jgi:hypothetical protein
MADLDSSVISDFFQRYNIPINPYLLIALILLGLVIIWYVIRFFLRLTLRIFFFGIIILVILGVSLFVFIYLS